MPPHAPNGSRSLIWHHYEHPKPPQPRTGTGQGIRTKVFYNLFSVFQGL
jgi:hypothetical protein